MFDGSATVQPSTAAAGLGQRLLEAEQVVHVVDQQADPVDHVEAGPGLLFGRPSGPHGQHQLLGDARARGARAHDDDLLVGHTAPAGAEGGEHGGHGHGRRALDVVVEGAEPVAVAVEKEVGVVLGEVLPLEEHVREHLRHGLYERLHERVVVGAHDPLMAPTEVVGVVAPFLVVGPDVQHDGQRRGRVDPTAGRVERQLADGDAEAVGPLVPEPEDPLAVGDDDDRDLVVGHRAEDVLDAVLIGEGEEEAPVVLVDAAELLARLPHRRGVDERQHAVHVLDEHPQEQGLVVVLHVAQQHVPGQIGRLVRQLGPNPVDPLLDGLDVGRHQAVQAQGVALVDGERGALVQQGVAQEVQAAKADRLRFGVSGHRAAPVVSRGSTGSAHDIGLLLTGPRSFPCGGWP